MTRHKLALALVLIPGLLACGKAATDKSKLSGTTWSQDCGLTGTSTDSLTFTETTLTYTSTKYDSASTTKGGCKTADYSTTTVYSYVVGDEIGSEVNAFKGARKLDLTLVSISYLPITADGKTAIAAICTGPTFTVGTSVDVLADATATISSCTVVNSGPRDAADRTTAVRSKAGDLSFNSIVIEDIGGDKQLMYLGSSVASSDGLSDGARQLPVNASTPYEKR